MLEINLLPEKQKIRISSKIKKEIIIYIASICVVLVAIFSMHQRINQRIKSLKEKVHHQEIIKRKCFRKAKKIAKLKKELKRIQKKIDIIKNIRKAQIMPLIRLDEIERLIPYQKLWFKNIDLVKNRLNLTGIALDNQALAFYIQNLRKSKYIQNVSFKKAERKYIANLKLVDFNCEIKFGLKAR